MRHSLLYTRWRRRGSSLPLLQAILNSDQILNAKVGSAGGRKNKRVGSSQIGPAGGQKAHASVLVAVIDTILAPLPPLGYQIQRLTTERMKWMGYAETWSRIARLKCIRWTED